MLDRNVKEEPLEEIQTQSLASEDFDHFFEAMKSSKLLHGSSEGDLVPKNMFAYTAAPQLSKNQKKRLKGKKKTKTKTNKAESTPTSLPQTVEVTSQPIPTKDINKTAVEQETDKTSKKPKEIKVPSEPIKMEKVMQEILLEIKEAVLSKSQKKANTIIQRVKAKFKSINISSSTLIQIVESEECKSAFQNIYLADRLPAKAFLCFNDAEPIFNIFHPEFAELRMKKLTIWITIQSWIESKLEELNGKIIEKTKMLQQIVIILLAAVAHIKYKEKIISVRNKTDAKIEECLEAAKDEVTSSLNDNLLIKLFDLNTTIDETFKNDLYIKLIKLEIHFRQLEFKEVSFLTAILQKFEKKPSQPKELKISPSITTKQPTTQAAKPKSVNSSIIPQPKKETPPKPSGSQTNTNKKNTLVKTDMTDVSVASPTVIQPQSTSDKKPIEQPKEITPSTSQINSQLAEVFKAQQEDLLKQSQIIKTLQKEKTQLSAGFLTLFSLQQQALLAQNKSQPKETNDKKDDNKLNNRIEQLEKELNELKMSQQQGRTEMWNNKPAHYQPAPIFQQHHIQNKIQYGLIPGINVNVAQQVLDIYQNEIAFAKSPNEINHLIYLVQSSCWAWHNRFTHIVTIEPNPWLYVNQYYACFSNAQSSSQQYNQASL